MAQHGKRFRALQGKVEQGQHYSLDEGVALLKGDGSAKFDESIDMAVRLGVNPRQADQMVRGVISLPHGVGKAIRVVVFADGEGAKLAEAAGADFVGGDELVEKIQKEGWTDFDKAIATRAMMAKVGRLGRVLGPRGLMPNPKTGTVCAPEKVGEVVSEVKAGRIDFRVDRAGIVHSPVGKVSMDADKIRDNILALIGMLVRLKPSSAKGTYMKTISVSTTMGPGIRLDANELSRAVAQTR